MLSSLRFYKAKRHRYDPGRRVILVSSSPRIPVSRALRPHAAEKTLLAAVSQPSEGTGSRRAPILRVRAVAI